MKTEEAEKLCNNLQSAAGRKLTSEINQAESYHYGYIQACEDFLSGVRKSNLDTPQFQPGTARRPIGIERDYYEPAGAIAIFGRCPECDDSVAVMENFCKSCGTKLDWSHERNRKDGTDAG